MESKTRLRAALDLLFASQKLIPTSGGQMCGAEMWMVQFSGFMRGEVYEALEAAEREETEARAEIDRQQKELEKSLFKTSEFHRLYQKAAGKLERVLSQKRLLLVQKAELKAQLAQDRTENERLKSDIQKMKVCQSCKHNDRDDFFGDSCTCPDTIHGL